MTYFDFVLLFSFDRLENSKPTDQHIFRSVKKYAKLSCLLSRKERRADADFQIHETCFVLSNNTRAPRLRRRGAGGKEEEENSEWENWTQAQRVR